MHCGHVITLFHVKKIVLHKLQADLSQYQVSKCKSRITTCNWKNIRIKIINCLKARGEGFLLMYNNNLGTVTIHKNMESIIKLNTWSWKDMCYAISVSCEHRIRAWHIKKKLLNLKNFPFSISPDNLREIIPLFNLPIQLHTHISRRYVSMVSCDNMSKRRNNCPCTNNDFTNLMNNPAFLRVANLLSL